MNLANIDDYRDTASQEEAPLTLDDVWAGLETVGGAMIVVPAWRETFYGPVEDKEDKSHALSLKGCCGALWRALEAIA